MERAARARLHEDLIRLSDGERAAFDPVFRAAWPPARELARRMLGEGAEAEDVAQQGLLKVFERAGEFDPERGEALPWILSVVAWECRTARKRQERRREDGEQGLSPLSDGAGSPEELAIQRDLEAAFQGILGILRPVDRETLELMLRGGSSPLAAATFRKRLQRALARFRGEWRERHGPG